MTMNAVSLQLVTTMTDALPAAAAAAGMAWHGMAWHVTPFLVRQERESRDTHYNVYICSFCSFYSFCSLSFDINVFILYTKSPTIQHCKDQTTLERPYKSGKTMQHCKVIILTTLNLL